MNKVRLSLTWIFAILLFLFEWSYAGDGTFTRNAQRQKNPGEIIRFTCTVDSLDTLTSNRFDLEKYQNSYWGVTLDSTRLDDTYDWYNPIRFPFKVQYQALSAVAAPRVTAYIQGSVDGTNWFNVDTLFSDFTSEAITRADINLNNQKVPWYRLLLYGITGSPPNRADTIFDLFIYAYQREN
jgi:hypothetical protein